MTHKPTLRYAGGCQCGAIRYALHARPEQAHLCHCRMCQKALGNAFAALAPVRLEDFVWTRGAPAVFRSSSAAERGFCSACGTPLFFRYVESDWIDVTIGSLDDPERAARIALRRGESALLVDAFGCAAQRKHNARRSYRRAGKHGQLSAPGP